ncbi:hypothetical protein KQH40_00820 [bacterium]|nr:hypothetical protein [bacterium]
MITSSKKADALCERALEIQTIKLAKRDLDALLAFVDSADGVWRNESPCLPPGWGLD